MFSQGSSFQVYHRQFRRLCPSASSFLEPSLTRRKLTLEPLALQGAEGHGGEVDHAGAGLYPVGFASEEMASEGHVAAEVDRASSEMAPEFASRRVAAEVDRAGAGDGTGVCVAPEVASGSRDSIAAVRRCEMDNGAGAATSPGLGRRESSGR